MYPHLLCFSSCRVNPPQNLFPLEKQDLQETETDEDEDTAANSAQLAEWEGVEPAQAEEFGFGGFDGVNPGDSDDGGMLFSPEQGAAAAVFKASPRYVLHDCAALRIFFLRSPADRVRFLVQTPAVGGGGGRPVCGMVHPAKWVLLRWSLLLACCFWRRVGFSGAARYKKARRWKGREQMRTWVYPSNMTLCLGAITDMPSDP